MTKTVLQDHSRGTGPNGPIIALRRAWCAVFHYSYWRFRIYPLRPNTNDFGIELYCARCGMREILEYIR